MKQNKNETKALFAHIKGDFLGGITAGIVALPLALAFGLSSGLGPEAGLYGAIFIGFFAAIFGGTATQVSGPTAPMTAVSMIVIAGIIQANAGDVEAAMPAILSVFLLAGLIQIGLGAIGIGKYIRYIPYPVVSGFMTAIGVIIIVTQILPILGYYPNEDTAFVKQFKPEAEEVILKKILKDEAGEDILVLEDFTETVSRAQLISESEVTQESEALASSYSGGVVGAIRILPKAIQNVNWVELIIAFCTVFIIYGFKRISTKIPSTLVALIVVSIGAYVLSYFSMISYRPIPEIPSGIPIPNFEIFTNFNFEIISPYIFSAITLAFLGAIDSLLTSVVADNMTKTKHKPNRELFGQGIGNSIASIFGGIPGAGATIRTVVNINAGGKTRVSGAIAALLLLIVLLLLSGIASQIPAAVLAGILLTVGIGVMDYKGLSAIPRSQKAEVFVMIVVLVLSVFWNLVYAVGVGLVLASLIFMKKLGDVTENLSHVTPLDDFNDDRLPGESIPIELKEKVFVKRFNGPLFFGSTTGFSYLSEKIPPGARHAFFMLSNVPYIDQSGLYALEDVILNLEQKNVEVHLIDVKSQPYALMHRIGIMRLIGEDFVHPSFEDAIEKVKKFEEEGNQTVV